MWLRKELKDNKAVRALNQNRDIPLSSLISEALIISESFLQKPRSILVVKQNLYNAQRLYDRISTVLPESECALFGADESLRVEAIASSPQMTALKVETLSALLKNPHQVVITCPSALLRFLPHPEDFRNGCIHLKTGDEIDMKELQRRLQAGGYQPTAHIDQPLCYASRGGIVDVFSINYPNPIRIEFFDTEIESIRFFDVATQKTIETVPEIEIVPASDVLFTESEIAEIREEAEKILSKTNELDPCGIAILDIDDFKRINDELGNDIGDEVLRTLGQVLQSIIDEDTIVGRYGGDTFVIVFENGTRDENFEVLNQIRKEFAKKKYSFTKESVTISGGYAWFDVTMDLESALKEAGAALSNAKKSGKNMIMTTGESEE